MTSIMTIERFILHQQANFPDATGAMTNLLYDIALAAKIIARETTRFGLGDIMGSSDTANVHGERQQKLDLDLQPVQPGNIVCIHPGDILTTRM